MWMFSRRERTKVSTPKEDEAAKAPTYARQKDSGWGIREGSHDNGAISLQLLQDLRDELKALNARLTTMDENFRLVFGVEDKDGD